MENQDDIDTAKLMIKNSMKKTKELKEKENFIMFLLMKDM